CNLGTAQEDAVLFRTGTSREVPRCRLETVLPRGRCLAHADTAVAPRLVPASSRAQELCDVAVLDQLLAQLPCCRVDIERDAVGYGSGVDDQTGNRKVAVAGVRGRADV